jgi:hypothetical protein
MNLHRQLTELTRNGTWTGTATELLSALGGEGTPEHLSRELSRRATDLAAVGIRVTKKRQGHNRTRLWIIERMPADGNRADGKALPADSNCEPRTVAADANADGKTSRADGESSKVTVNPDQGDGEPETVTAEGNATSDVLTKHPKRGHPLNCPPCVNYQNGWCMVPWPRKAINAKALTACPLVAPNYGYRWPGSISENSLDPSKPSSRDWLLTGERAE